MACGVIACHVSYNRQSNQNFKLTKEYNMITISQKTFKVLQDLPFDTHNISMDIYKQELTFHTISPQHYALKKLLTDGKLSINELDADERVSVRVYLDKL